MYFTRLIVTSVGNLCYMLLGSRFCSAEVPNQLSICNLGLQLQIGIRNGAYCLLNTCTRREVSSFASPPALSIRATIDCKSWPSVKGLVTYVCAQAPKHEVTLNKKSSLRNFTVCKSHAVERPFSLHAIVRNLVAAVPIVPVPTSFPLSPPLLRLYFFVSYGLTVSLLVGARRNKNGLHRPSPL